MMCMLMLQGMSKASSIPRQESAFCLDIAKNQRPGYRLFDLIRTKVLHSHDVRFNETEKKKNEDKKVTTNDDPDQYLILDLPSDNVPEVLTDSQALQESQVPEELVPEPELRKSSRDRHQPNYYEIQQSHLSEYEMNPYQLRKPLLVPIAPNGWKLWELKLTL